MIVAEGLAETCRAGRSRPIAADRAYEGRRSKASASAIPLYERDSVGVLADYVTLEQGTGAVHTAPGHGADDFLTGVKYGLDIYAPVGPGAISSRRSSCSAGNGVRCEPARGTGAARARPAVAPGDAVRTSTRTAGAATTP